MALIERLAHLSDVLQVAGSAGAVLGAIVGGCLPTRRAGGFLDQVAVGTAVGGALGVLAGFGAYIGVEISAVVGLAAAFRKRKIGLMSRSDQPQGRTVAHTVSVLALGFATSVVAGFLLGVINAPPVAFYAFVLLLTAIGVLQILAPGGVLRSSLDKQDPDER